MELSKLEKKSVVTDDTVFVRHDRLENALVYTKEMWDNATEWYRLTYPDKVGRGKYPVNPILTEWHKAGLPIVNGDEIRMERLAIAEDLDREVDELSKVDPEIYAEARKAWIERGKPEPVKFLPKRCKAKFIGYIIEDGKITEKEKTVHVWEDDLAVYREANEITGPSGQETYAGTVEDELEDISVHTLVTPNKITSMINGKALSAKDMAIAERDRALAAKAKLEKENQEKTELALAMAKAVQEGNHEVASRLAAQIAAKG